jgi:hypothetical protein
MLRTTNTIPKSAVRHFAIQPDPFVATSRLPQSGHCFALKIDSGLPRTVCSERPTAEKHIIRLS